MASFCRQFIYKIGRRYISSTNAPWAGKVVFGDPIEQATGVQKRELLGKIAGNDPFDLRVIKRGAGTRGQPNEIPSANDARLVGCICEEGCASINWMWLHKGEPKRCECGHWFSLVHKAPV